MEGGSTATGMQSIVTQLTTGVTAQTIWGVVSDIMPFVIIMIIVSLGLVVLRRVIGKAGKGKAGI